MKNILVLSLLSLVVFSACAQKRLGPLTSKEAIFKYLQKTQADLSHHDVCLDSCTLLSDLFIVGYFAHDRGCANPIYFFKGEEIQLKNKTIKAILLNSGFEKDTLKTVENFHMEVTNHYQYILTEASDEFDTMKYIFTPPTTKILKGMIISTMWVQVPSGRTRTVVFHFSTVIFELDGSFVEHKKTEHFAVVR